ncbi:MAG: hypothetical protein B6U97_01225 [Candidatus Altiarchaeales archaeon ex4484_96]|nr:MAG: hypothetical protein B6U97_01225 [Candidatus Altiarchaeales archaeon ex4484_96]
MFTNQEKKELEKINLKSRQVINSVYLKNGGITASTSDGRYPYVYPRDTVMILMALDHMGDHKRVKKTLDFLMSRQRETGEWAQRYDKKGNIASYRPPQVDCNGLVLHMLRLYYEATEDKKFIEKHRDAVKLGTEFIKEHYLPEEKLIFSLNSIHEWPPMEAGFDIWVNITCYVGVRGSYKIAQSLGQEDVAESWRDLARDIWIGISKKLIIKNRFIKLSDHRQITDADVSELAPYITRCIGVKETVMRNTINYIEKNLWDDELGGIRRYMEKHGEPGRNNGGYGPYSMYTGWMAQYYLDAGEEEKAKKYINWFLKYHRGYLIPEHVSTKKSFKKWMMQAKKTGRYYHVGRKQEAQRAMKSEEYKKDLIYWVTPLTWAHAEYLKLYHMLEEKQLI